MRYIVLILLVSYGCSIPQSRQEVEVSFDRDKEILETYDGFIHRFYDVRGRLIESYGNPKRNDDNANYHTFIEYSNNNLVVVAKVYVLADSNIKCLVDSTSKYHLIKYTSSTDGIFSELIKPIYEGNKVMGHESISKTEVPFIPFLEKKFYPK